MKQEILNGHQIYTWQLGASTFKAIPEAGARLLSWDVRFAGKQRSVIYWPEDADWSRFANIRGGNPILFPFVARTYDKGTMGFWKTPEGERLPMPSHGYARQGAFAVEHADESGFRARFIEDAASRQGYPYAYVFYVEYRFSELALEVDLILENQDERPIPWCAGHHFYFTLPWHEGHTRADYRVLLPAKKAFYPTGEGGLSPVKAFETECGFDVPELSERLHCKLKENVVRFGPRSGEEDVCVRFGDTPVPSAWDTVVTWTQDEASPFYCVEPWMGLPNAPEHKKGLHFVDAGQRACYTVSVSLG